MNATCNQAAFAILFVEIQVCQTDCHGTCCQAFGNTNLAIQIDFRSRVIFGSNCFVINQLSAQSGKCIDYLIPVAGVDTAAVGIKRNACVLAVSLSCLVNNNVTKSIKACIAVFTIFMCQICIYITGQILDIDVLRFLLEYIACSFRSIATIEVGNYTFVRSGIFRTGPRMENQSLVIPSCTIGQPKVVIEFSIFISWSVKMAMQIRIRCSQANIDSTALTIEIGRSAYITGNLYIIIAGAGYIAIFILKNIDINHGVFAGGPDRFMLVRKNTATADAYLAISLAGKNSSRFFGFDIYKSLNINGIGVFLSSIVKHACCFQCAPIKLISRSRNTASDCNSVFFTIIIIDNNMSAGIGSSSCRCPDGTAIIVVVSGFQINSTWVINRNCTLSISSDSGCCPHRLTAGASRLRESIKYNAQIMSLHINSVGWPAFSCKRTGFIRSSTIVVDGSTIQCITPNTLRHRIKLYLYHCIVIKGIFQILAVSGSADNVLIACFRVCLFITEHYSYIRIKNLFFFLSLTVFFIKSNIAVILSNRRTCQTFGNFYSAAQITFTIYICRIGQLFSQVIQYLINKP